MSPPRWPPRNVNATSALDSGQPGHADATLRLVLTVTIVLTAGLTGVLVARFCKWCLNRSAPPDDSSDVSEHTKRLLRMQKQQRHRAHQRRQSSLLTEEEKVNWHSVVLDMWQRRRDEENYPAHLEVEMTEVPINTAEAAERQLASLRRLRDAWSRRARASTAAAAAAETSALSNGPDALTAPGPLANAMAPAVTVAVAAQPHIRAVVANGGTGGGRLRDTWTARRSRRLTEVAEEVAASVAAPAAATAGTSVTETVVEVDVHHSRGSL